MSTQNPVFHESDYQQGKWKDGTWYCKHGDKAAERVAVNSKSLAYVGLKFWICVQRPSCRFYLWEDHLVEALRYHQVPEDVIQKMTPKKRKRDRDITEYFPVTPKTPRTRDVEVNGDSGDDIYELSDQEASPSGRHRDLSPTPLPRRSNAPSRSLGPPSPPSSWEDALQEAAVHADRQITTVPAPPPSMARPYSVLNILLSSQGIAPPQASQAPTTQTLGRPSTPPPAVRTTQDVLGPAASFSPQTPSRQSMARHHMPLPNPTTPGSGRRKLSNQELETYNVVVKALAGANVKLSAKGQKALREIIKEEDFWIGS